MKSKLNVVLLGILIFVLGGVAGAVSYYIYRDHNKAAAAKTGTGPRDIVEGMARELNLDAQQKEKLRVIFGESRNRFQELNERFRPLYENLNNQFWPQWQKIRDETDDQVRKILRPDQKAHFEEFLKKVHAAGLPKPRPPK
jgi:Spy/CpxP family protein refolding chaperone